MSKLQIFQKYFTCFYSVGLSSRFSIVDTSRSYSSIFHLVPQVTLLILAILRLSAALAQMNISQLQAINGLRILTYLPYIYASIQGMFDRKATEEILQSFDVTITNFERIFGPSINLKAFDKRFFIKFVSNILANVIVYSLKAVYIKTPSILFQITDISSSILFTVKCVSALFVAFFVDLLQFLLRSVNSELQSISEDACFHSTKSLSEKGLITTLKSVKSYHLKCHQIVNQIHQRFGWFMVFFMLESTIASISVLFWVFYYVVTADNPLMAIARKYCF